MKNHTLYIDAVGIVAPGLEGWNNSIEVIKGNTPFNPTPLPKYKPTLLPPNERRRATELVRLAFRCCEDACADSNIDLSKAAAVFASSGGDYNIIDSICRTMKSDDRSVSPTQFHNSVHNSAAGYWSIATGSQACSTSLSAYDWSFSSGLMEAASFVITEQQTTLFTCYDIPPPAPLFYSRPITSPFAIALLLQPEASPDTFASLTCSLDDTPQVASTCDSAIMEKIRLGNPAAASLPLLEYLANKKEGRCRLKTYSEQMLNIEISIC